MILYDLTNPSDPVTFQARSVEAAAGAIALLSHGQLAARPIDANGNELDAPDQEVPFFMFGGFDEWLQKRGLTPETLVERHRKDIAAALLSFCTGTQTERALYDSALAAITDDDARAKFIATWDDKKRSSLNEITNIAHRLGAQLQT